MHNVFQQSMEDDVELVGMWVVASDCRFAVPALPLGVTGHSAQFAEPTFTSVSLTVKCE